MQIKSSKIYHFLLTGSLFIALLACAGPSGPGGSQATGDGGNTDAQFTGTGGTVGAPPAVGEIEPCFGKPTDCKDSKIPPLTEEERLAKQIKNLDLSAVQPYGLLMDGRNALLRGEKESIKTWVSAENSSQIRGVIHSYDENSQNGNRAPLTLAFLNLGPLPLTLSYPTLLDFLRSGLLDYNQSSSYQVTQTDQKGEFKIALNASDRDTILVFVLDQMTVDGNLDNRQEYRDFFLQAQFVADFIFQRGVPPPPVGRPGG